MIYQELMLIGVCWDGVTMGGEQPGRMTGTEHNSTVVLNACFRLSQQVAFIERVMGDGILLIYLSEPSVLFRRQEVCGKTARKAISYISGVAKTCQRVVARGERWE